MLTRNINLLLTITVLLISAPRLFAAPDFSTAINFESCPQLLQNRFKSILLTDPTTTCAQVLRVDGILEGVDALFPADQPMTRVGLRVMPDPFFGYAQFDGYSLRISSVDDTTLDRDELVLVHEYAHAILSEILLANVPDFAQFYEYQERFGLNNMRLSKIRHKGQVMKKELTRSFLKKCNKDDSSELSDSQRADLNSRLKILEQSRIKASNTFYDIQSELFKEGEDRQFENLSKSIKPYQEFFADLVAVLYANDGAATSQLTLRICEEQGKAPQSLEVQVALLKDFTRQENKYENWLQLWNPNKTEDKTSPAYEGHAQLSPSRYHVWDIINNKLKCKPTSIPRVLIIVANTIIEQYHEFTVKPFDEWTLAERNKNFMKLLSKNLDPQHFD